jgi:hypothetical protein
MHQMTKKTGRFLGIGRMRTRFFYKALAQSLAQLLFLMLFVPDLPVIGPVVAPRAHAQTGGSACSNSVNPGQSQILQSVCSYITPAGQYNPLVFNATPPTAALQQFESDTVQSFLTLHGLPSTDASLIYQYGRTDLRTQLRGYMFGRLLSISLEGASQRTANEQTVYEWFRLQMSALEYALLQAAIADHNNWVASPCTWTPDPSVAAAYGLVYNGAEICRTIARTRSRKPSLSPL